MSSLTFELIPKKERKNYSHSNNILKFNPRTNSNKDIYLFEYFCVNLDCNPSPFSWPVTLPQTPGGWANPGADMLI